MSRAIDILLGEILEAIELLQRGGLDVMTL
jgi:hypothetical protein